MITRYTCALNGVSLDSLAACIHITDVQELAPRQHIVTARVPGDGLHVLRACREQIAVRVTFIVYEYDTALRRSVLQKITDGGNEILDSIRQGHIAYVINTREVNSSMKAASDGYEIRRAATENNVTIFTALDTVRVLLDVLEETTLCISTIDA